MKERFAVLVSLLIMLTLVIGTWWAADYSERAVEIDPPSRMTHEPDNWAEKIVLLRTDKQGNVIHRLEGDRMEHFPDDKSYEVDAPRAFSLRPDNPLTVATSRIATTFVLSWRRALNSRRRGATSSPCPCTRMSTIRT